ncbi:DUF2382 domain-containing protein [Deinococcus soli (ex Cha et al. 2016)]|uniref:Stress response protein YsnF n=2 Tax=Deinococcus soli (ex Cha et al. 2016) TaxID=1309411 RepID=A0AAE3XFD8_9DEIO|nr:DUF2382 domain-containing protein [Deinococcus soli (ex Cha et al. 2016)]MDR6221070.1 stress response protein YsnF [Deinococcus soli (ex Cha et al. 2016)]MDR6330989.1 stress response protein YsnF [Deinococcus soli (ex Cha et al. 2016)]MDR6754185.1 stress response protein YsnF [Deinococcus soli (ex Cha et al. 2016)]
MPHGTLELREERAVVEKQRVVAGHVTVRRERRVRVEHVQIELAEEVLVIETMSGTGRVMVNGVSLEPGAVQEVILSQEQAKVVKQLYVVEDVEITKVAHVVLQTVPVELAYEELVLDQQDGEGHLTAINPLEEESGGSTVEKS